MRIAIVALLLAPQMPALAVDFRGVQIGQSCRKATEVELSLGTKPRHEIELMISQGIVVFEDQSIAGQHAQLLYSCTQTPGIISRYSIDIRTRSEPRAWGIYADAKAAAVSRLGVPQFDSEAPEAKEKLRQLRRNGLTGNHAVANWTTVENQRVSVMIEKLPDDGEWSVATIVSEKPPKSPDKSLERTRER